MKKTRVIVVVGMLIGMEIILTRFFAFQTATLRIGFGFIPISMLAMMFGPVIGGLGSALSDILGMMVFPRGGPFFPGFTLNALLRGVILGLFLYKREKSVVRVAFAVFTTTVIIDLGLTTVWLSILTGRAAAVLMVERILKSVIMFPVEVIIITVVWKRIGEFIRNKFVIGKSTV